MSWPLMLVIRTDEIHLKGGNRRHFSRLLLAHVRSVARRLDPEAEIWQGHHRIFITPKAPVVLDAVAAQVARCPGVASVSPAMRVPRDVLDEQSGHSAMLAPLLQAAHGLCTEAWQHDPGPFKVKTKRLDKTFPIDSQAVSRLIGGPLQTALDRQASFKQRDRVLTVEIMRRAVYLSARRLEGAGGLPSGSTGGVLLLLSGGIDSPVAGDRLQQRGCTLEAVHFTAPPLTGAEAVEKVRLLSRLLGRRQSQPLPLHVIPLTRVFEQLNAHCDPAHRLVLLRRHMMRVAHHLAHARGLGALGTGESLGQVASQTLEALSRAQGALPPGALILRPLVGAHKDQIIAEARALGTYEISVRPYPDCCALMTPAHPALHPSVDAIEAEERHLDIAHLTQHALSQVCTELFET
ncbi:MAG: tRNA uracil 4-sulfurtransferase ThiI [Bradymonadia bacterium]